MRLQTDSGLPRCEEQTQDLQRSRLGVCRDVRRRLRACRRADTGPAEMWGADSGSVEMWGADSGPAEEQTRGLQKWGTDSGPVRSTHERLLAAPHHVHVRSSDQSVRMRPSCEDAELWSAHFTHTVLCDRRHKSNCMCTSVRWERVQLQSETELLLHKNKIRRHN